MSLTQRPVRSEGGSSLLPVQLSFHCMGEGNESQEENHPYYGNKMS